MLSSVFKGFWPYQYRLVLISSILILFALPLPHMDYGWYELIYACLTSFNVFASLVLISGTMNWRNILIVLIGVVVVCIQFVDLVLPIPGFSTLLGALFVIFFVSISIRVYKDIFRARKIDIEILAAVFSGYVFLGFLASFLFYIIETLWPGSYIGLAPGEGSYETLRYFSFISLLTIGDGDIIPGTPLARTLAVLIGLIGNFYTAIVTAIVIGKFLIFQQTNNTGREVN